MSEEKLRILCVDDEPRVLHGLERHLSDHFEVLTANDGAAGLNLLSREKDVAIIIADMRMPEMDGATFLQHARKVVPNAVRILLTGHADVQAAIKSVNLGQVFRFLTKPCPPADLSVVMEEAKRQHELIVAEKTLLHRTLVGCIKALVDTMSIVNPAAMGRAVRLKRRVSSIAQELELERRWQVEAAAMLSALGTIALPPNVVQKLTGPTPLTDLERAEVQAATRAANRVISQIPRLEPVGRLLDHALGVESGEPLGTVGEEHLELLRLAMEVDALEAHGKTAEEALAELRSQERYSAGMLEAAARALLSTRESSQPMSVPLTALRPGMILDQDIHTNHGLWIAPRGLEVTPNFLIHLRKFEGGVDQDTIRVIGAAA
jgi:CheY-like chemotaxis protein